MLGVLANILIAFVDVPLDKTEATVFLFLLAGLALGYVERIRWGSPHSRQITGTHWMSVVSVGSQTRTEKGNHACSN